MRLLREKRIYRGLVTSRYKKYCLPILVGLLGFSDELVTDIKQHNHMSEIIAYLSYPNYSFSYFWKSYKYERIMSGDN
jgi:hypothetical protein